ncbi:uncharacterized protein LOC134222347 [Armigeres subalbatus]|uniref:uncharacterized protein LOC134222347 n=1 Tax=Armigeres subalbatus TaxID=124917 RepID=UPI002ED5B7DC
MCDQIKNRPLPPIPSIAEANLRTRGVPPQIPPRRIDYENSKRLSQQNAVVGSSVSSKSVQNIPLYFQESTSEMNGITSSIANSSNAILPDTLHNIYEGTPVRSSVIDLLSAVTEDSFTRESTFDATFDDTMDRNRMKRLSTSPANAVDELLQNEQKYIDNLMNGILNFIPLLYHMNLPAGLCGQRNNLFGNIEEIHELHQDEFIPALGRCYQNVEQIAECFIHFIETDKLYCYVKYALNRRKAGIIFERHRDYFSSNQHEVNSFLLQPIQRLPHYKLFLEKFLKETTKFGNTGTSVSIRKAQDKLSDLMDLVNAAVSISDIPQCASEFSAIAAFPMTTLGFNRDNDLACTLILKPKGNKIVSRNNPIDLFAQGKFVQIIETEIYDESRYRKYRSKFFVFEKLLIYTEIAKDKFSYRGHYYDSEINCWEDSRKLHLFCLHRGTQEIHMDLNQSLANTVRAIRKRAIAQFFNEPQLIDFDAVIEPHSSRTSVGSDINLDNGITSLINSQISYIQVFRANFEFYFEFHQQEQDSQFSKFKDTCIQMDRLHHRVLQDLSINVGNILEICTIFLQYVKTEFPPVYGDYLQLICNVAKYCLNRTGSNDSNAYLVSTIDDFLYLCIERLQAFAHFFATLTDNLSKMITINASFDRSLYHQLAVAQVELDTYAQNVNENYRLLRLDDGAIECGLVVSSMRAKVRSVTREFNSCRIFICERGVICVACSKENQFTKRNDNFESILFCDKFADMAQPMRLRKSDKHNDAVCFTIGSVKYKIKFQTSQTRDTFYMKYARQKCMLLKNKTIA